MARVKSETEIRDIKCSVYLALGTDAESHFSDTEVVFPGSRTHRSSVRKAEQNAGQEPAAQPEIKPR